MNNRPRIIYIANARLPTQKAHGIAIMRACGAFARAGAGVCLVAPQRRGASISVFREYDVEQNFDISFLPTVDLLGTFVPDRFAFFLQSMTFYSAAALWLLFRSRTAVIYTRDTPPLFSAWLGFRVAYECHALSSHKEAFFFAARRAKKLITISQALKNAFVRAGFSAERILVAPSGVDHATFDINVPKTEARRQLGLPLDAPIAVYTGNFTTMGADKGITDCIAALSAAPEILFVAVGGSPEDIAHYEARAREAGVAERVVLRPYAPQKVLALYQKAADMLLMPFPDTPHYRFHMSPVKMFEYMVSGRPIIASDLPTIREVLNEKNAFIITPSDPHALARAMQEIARDPGEAEARASRARAQARDYSWDSRAVRVLRFIVN